VRVAMGKARKGRITLKLLVMEKGKGRLMGRRKIEDKEGVVASGMGLPGVWWPRKGELEW